VGVRFVFLYFFYIINKELTHNTLLTLTVRRDSSDGGRRRQGTVDDWQGRVEGTHSAKSLLVSVLRPKAAYHRRTRACHRRPKPPFLLPS
jgi:hypothetical protein